MTYLAAAVLVMAAVTYLPRVLPVIAFRREIKSNLVRSVLYYLPFAVLGAMTIPSILYSTESVYSALAGLITGLVLAYFERSLLIVALGAVAAVYIFELFL
jgi:branched-subunit amino acid transport protein